MHKYYHFENGEFNFDFKVSYMRGETSKSDFLLISIIIGNNNIFINLEKSSDINSNNIFFVYFEGYFSHFIDQKFPFL